MRRILPLIPMIALVGACASKPAPTTQKTDSNGKLTENVGDAAGSAYSQTRDGFADAAMSPLEDFNLKREPIPEILKGVQSPYDMPETMSCDEITLRLAALDTVLGPDWDTPVPDERLRTEKLADSAAEATLGAIASEARGLIPFRGLVRKATGAESHEKKYNLAYKIGAQRRAYLKGMGLALDCPLPARPDFTVERDPTAVTFKGDAPTVENSGAYDAYQQKQLDNLTPVGPSEPTLSTPTQPAVDDEGLQTVPPQY